MKYYTYAIRQWHHSTEGPSDNFTEFCDKLQNSGWEIVSIRPSMNSERDAKIIVRKPRI